MGFELAVRFAKPQPQSDVATELRETEGILDNGQRGQRWENAELEGFFLIDCVPAKKGGLLGRGKPKLAGIDITVPWGGPAEEIDLLTQMLELLAAKFDLTVTSPQLTGGLSAGEFDALGSAWHGPNVQALTAHANTEGAGIRHRQENFDEDDPERVEMLDAIVTTVDADQRDIHQANCAMHIAQGFQRCGEHHLAILAAHRIAELRPEEPFARILLGISFAALEDNDTATKVFQAALALAPDGPNADYAQAMLDQLGAVA